MTPGEQIRVRVSMPDEDGSWCEEILWARFLGNNLAKIESIPCMASMLCEGDSVRIDDAADVVDIVEKAATTRCARFPVEDDDEATKSISLLVKNHFERSEIHVEFGAIGGLVMMAVPLDIDEYKLQTICMECPVKLDLYPPDDDVNSGE